MKLALYKKLARVYSVFVNIFKGASAKIYSKKIPSGMYGSLIKRLALIITNNNEGLGIPVHFCWNNKNFDQGLCVLLYFGVWLFLALANNFGQQQAKLKKALLFINWFAVGGLYIKYYL